MIRALKNLFKGRKSVKSFKDLPPEDMMVDELVKEWLKNKNSESDHFWEHWLVQHPGKRESLSKMKSIINAIDYKHEGHMEAKDYVEIYENVYSQSPTDSKVIPMSFRFSWFAKVAAIIAFTLGSTYLFNEWGAGPSEAEITVPKVKLVVKECPAGMKATFRLKDGTVIKLNSNSKLTYPEYFSDTLREVWLEGEAYFQVKKESARPFIVRAGALDIKVLGTSFNVNHRLAKNKNEVALVSGKLQVSNAQKDSLLILPEEMVALDDDGQLRKGSFDVKKVLAWQKGILAFDNEGFEDIVEKLESWYGVEIEVGKGFHFKGTYTGTFDNEDLDNVLKGISQTSHFSFKIENDKVLIH